MSLRIVVVPINHNAGVTTACLGLTHALDLRRVSVGYVKPFGRSMTSGEDPAAELFRLATPLRPVPPIPFSHVEEMLADGREEELMEEVLAMASDTLGAHRVVVVEGVAPDLRQVHARHLNVEVTRTLDADVVLVVSTAGLTPDRLVQQVSAVAHDYRVSGGTRVLGVMLNRVPAGEDDGRFEQALEEAGHRVVAVLRERPEFTHPRVTDLVHHLGFEVLNPGDGRRRVTGSVVAAQSIPGFLPHLEDGRLVIVPGDRHEVLLSAALAEQNGTRLAALLITAGVRPDPDVLRLRRPALQNGLPLLFTDELTFEATGLVVGLDPDIPADDEDRARLVMQGAAAAFDEAWLDEVPRIKRVQRVTPAGFRLRLVSEATRLDTCMAVTDAEDPRVLSAVCALYERGVQQCLLVGDPGHIESVAATFDLTLPLGIRIVDPAAQEPADRRRLEQILTRSGAADVDPADPLVVALDLVDRGVADGLVTGFGRSEQEVIGLAAKIVGLREDVPVITSAHVLALPDETVLYTDCLLHEERPTDTLVTMALNAVEAAENVGITPRVALVTGRRTEAGSDEHERIAAAGDRIRDRRPDLAVEGPVLLEAAARRSAGGDAGGNATIFVFTDHATAQVTIRAVGRSSGASVYGPVLLGLRHPVNLLPPTATAYDVSDVIVGTATQVGHLR